MIVDRYIISQVENDEAFYVRVQKTQKEEREGRKGEKRKSYRRFVFYT
jgi:hypothetical protein